MESSWQADIIVGIDFGMTCTGVAYSLGPQWAEPKTIQHWPGKLGHELRNKVNSAVSYGAESGHLATWGFLCNEDDERFEYIDLFKLYLDPANKDDSKDAPTHEEARRWYEDYLRLLYLHIMKHFTDSMPRFASKRIEFVFSVPVTWMRNPAMLASIEDSIRRAGFGRTENERAGVYMHEAEAAAIYAARQSMAKGDVFLVCDSGGGTTDISVLKVENVNRGMVQLTLLTWSEGDNVGSTLIDFRMRAMIKNRLERIRGYVDGDLDALAERMMRDQFESFKCGFGTAGFNVPNLLLQVPGLPAGLDFPQVNIMDSKIVITREELQGIFDEQFQKMSNLVDKQVRLCSDLHSGENISYMIMSGGLGSSAYIQGRMKAKYESGIGGFFPGREGMNVLTANEPQLAVVHGIVMARVQSNRGGPEMYAQRCCPVSYGILSRELYDGEKHLGEDVVADQYDNKRWVERQITWMIRQGDVVSTEVGIRHRFRLKIAMGQERQAWKTRIVMSALPRDQLPNSMRSGGVKEVCALEAKLERHQLERKNRHWYNLKKEYNLADFEVRIKIDTGLKFEIWKDGVRSKEHREIEVQWEHADDARQAQPSQRRQEEPFDPSYYNRY